MGEWGCVCGGGGGNMSVLGSILSTWGQGRGSGVVFSTSGFSA